MDQQITAVIVNRKENKLKASFYPSISKTDPQVSIKKYRSHLERMRLSFGSIHSRDPHRNLLGNGIALVRRGNRALDQSRELVEIGIGVRGARWKATVPRCPRATSHPYLDLFDDRLLGLAHADVETHTDASIIWRFPLHGSCLAEGAAIFRQDSDHADAG